MELHRLELQAIGPFAGAHSIDFDALAQAGLFLLEGPTGAGKSTVIDAITFALFGQVAAQASSKDRMRSTHAAPGTDSYVRLTFSTPRGHFRVERTPAYAREKLRGEGMTDQKETAKLFRLAGADDEPGDLVSNRPQEVATEAAAALGLNREQFAKTVVLAQGEFAAFLHAKSEDRRPLLQRVFGTEDYDAWEKRLTVLRREAATQVADARQALAISLEGFTQAAALPESDAERLRALVPADRGRLGHLAAPTDEVVPAAQSHICDLAAAREAAEMGAKRAEADHGMALDANAAAVRLVADVGQYAAAAAQLEALESASERIEANRRTVGQLLARARIAPVLETARAARRQVAAAIDALAEIAGAQPASDEDRAIGERARTGWDERLAALVAERGAQWSLRSERAKLAAARLTELAALEAGLPARRATIAELRASAAAGSERAETLRAHLASRPATRRELDSALAAARALAATLPAAKAAVESAERRIADHAWCIARAAELEGLELERTAAAELAAEMVEAEHELRRRWVAGQAGRLASELAAGVPCPVCGSTEHPAPAELLDGHPTDEQVAAAEAARKEATETLAALASQVAVASSELTARRAPLADESPEQADANLLDARNVLAAANVAAASLERSARELDEFDDATDRLRAEETQAREQAARLTERAGSLAEGIEQDAATIAARLAEPDALDATTVAQLQAQLAADAATAGSLAELLAALASAGRDLAQAQAAAAEAMRRESLTESVLAELATFADADAARLEAEVRAHDEAVIRNTAELARLTSDAELNELVAAGDLANARRVAGERAAATAQQLATAEMSQAHAQGVLAVARARHDAASAALAGLRAAAATYREQAAREAPIRHVADVATAGSDNAKRVTLSSFVVMRRFDEVLAAANDRLRSMLDGRYELQRSEDKSTGARKGGLDMVVIDRVTDTPRAVGTLSGGETFCVSLALALGLADVVRAEAGGVDLGTLFVDEGFGSLSDGALDQVIAELSKLREGGRVVGVVSHVEALKAAIPERITVRSRPDGTSTIVQPS